jgi:putative hemolysin
MQNPTRNQDRRQDMHKHIFPRFWIMVVLLGLAACTSNTGAPATETVTPIGMPNPASVYCEEQGGRLEMRSDANGTYGVCIFDDGSECEEWAYYRGECAPGDAVDEESSQPDVGLANPASVYCEEQGGRLEMRSDADGTHGVCIFDNGGECEEWAYWRGECGPASDDARVNVALEANLARAVKLELLELDPAAESSQPYRLRLTIDDAVQLADIMRSLNTAIPRTPKTLCVPTFMLRFHYADGAQQEIGYMCDAAQATLSGEQGFWANQEAAAPASFVALMDSHLEGVQEPPAPGQSLNPVAGADLVDVQRIEVLVQTHTQKDGVAETTIQPLADIRDPATVAEIVASLNAELPLGPRARCIANVVLVFYRADGSTYNMGCGCELENATFLRGDEPYWQGQDAIAPPGFHELIQSAVELNSPASAADETTTRAVAWYGYVVSGEGGDHLVLYPEGAGELVLVGDEDEHEAQIAELRDKPEPGRNAHFWGTVDCDAGECTLVADRIRVDAPGPFFPPEPVEGWQGTLITMRTEPGSGPDDAFVLVGDWSVYYGVWSVDPELAAQLESLRDTGRSFRIWGELTAGVPDANATQILVTRIEPLD